MKCSARRYAARIARFRQENDALRAELARVHAENVALRSKLEAETHQADTVISSLAMRVTCLERKIQEREG